MIDHEARLAAYVQLACQSHQKRQALARDRFLWLAAAEACRAGWLAVAQRCRHLGLVSNPHHQAAWFDSVPDALRDPDFERVIAQYARQCPPERAEHLVHELKLDMHPNDPDQPLGDWLLNLLATITIDVPRQSSGQ